MENKKTICQHILDVGELKLAEKYECSECVEIGDQWVHLRTCQTCGQTLCCDASKNQHMTKHAISNNHPVAISSEPGERWLWCYVDKEAASY